MDILKITIKLNQREKNKFIQKYIREELGEKGEIRDNEIGIYLKSKILNYIEEINFKEKIDEIEKRIKELNNTHKYFYLRDLFSKEEWQEMKDYKLLLGRIFFHKCLNAEYAKKIGIKQPTDSDKDASGVQRYYKI